ncbi:hypothetical protein, partial [Pseudomonas syringae]|uniref:hypothetical protein n=3 Tax=Pseudomonas syringae TaxID=317 RepID=UPI002E335633
PEVFARVRRIDLGGGSLRGGGLSGRRVSRLVFLPASRLERGGELEGGCVLGGLAADCRGALDFWNTLPTLFSSRFPILPSECEERWVGCSVCCRIFEGLSALAVASGAMTFPVLRLTVGACTVHLPFHLPPDDGDCVTLLKSPSAPVWHGEGTGSTEKQLAETFQACAYASEIRLAGNWKGGRAT